MSSDIASIEAQLALNRASLADKIFARYDQSTSSNVGANNNKGSSGKKGKGKDKDAGGVKNTKEANFQHRPPTLGLGAQPQQQAVSQAGAINGDLSIADARLKGRLSNKKADLSHNQNGKRRADDSEEEAADNDDGESRAAAASKGNKKKAIKVDPFAAKPPKAGKQQPKQDEASDAQRQGAILPPASGRAGSSEGSESKLSKGQRKKLNKKRRLEAEQAASNAGQAECLSNAPSAAATASTSSTSFQPAAALPDMDASTSFSHALSDHQKSLHAKLQGSQFRQLNESLYTSESADSFRLAQEDPTRMQAYHEGFREQTKKWPEKPFEMIGNIIADAVEASWDRLANGSKKTKDAGGQIEIPPGAIVADLGAGEGPLAKYLATHAKFVNPKSAIPALLRPRVLAYDLLDTNDGIVRGVDCARTGGVPLPGKVGGGVNERVILAKTASSHAAAAKSKGKGKSATPQTATHATSAAIADVAVFCLSLMGTDWANMIIEARRILRSGGSLVIAEVTSRLSSVDAFVKLVEQLGFKLDHDTRLAGSSNDDDDDDGSGEDAAAAMAHANTHFILFRFHKWTDEEVAARDIIASSIEEARATDGKEEKSLVKKGQEVLKPCLYKRR